MVIYNCDMEYKSECPTSIRTEVQDINKNFKFYFGNNDLIGLSKRYFSHYNYRQSDQY